jgi:hypothetical protein
VLGFAVFSLYLILANFLYTLNFANLPFGAAVNNFIMPLVAVDIALVNLYAVYRRRRPQPVAPIMSQAALGEQENRGTKKLQPRLQ